MLWDIFKKQKKSGLKNITGDEMCDIFYNMLYYYNKHSVNIAVLKNKKIFEWQIKVWKEKINKERGDCLIKIDDDRFLFIIDEQEINIVMIRSIEDLYERQMKFRRYMG